MTPTSTEGQRRKAILHLADHWDFSAQRDVALTIVSSLCAAHREFDDNLLGNFYKLVAERNAGMSTGSYDDQVVEETLDWMQGVER